jgi:diacylglycerol kinase family enzyme
MRSPVSAYTVYDDAGNSVKAELTKAIATGVATTVVKGGSGRLVNAVITTAGTSSDNLTIYDNASAGSGAILAVIPGGTTLTGAQVPIDLPCANGITVVNVSGGPAVTIGYS